MAMKDFEIAADEVDAIEEEDDKNIEFRLKDKDGDWVVYSSAAPTEGQIALFMARTQNGVAAGFNAMEKFMKANFDPDSYREIIARIEDRRDPLGMTAMIRVIYYIIEEATGNPSTESSTSTSSQPRTGNGSKANTRVKASTSSASRRAGS